ncbi:MAG: TolC family protein, partial [bacterium]
MKDLLKEAAEVYHIALRSYEEGEVGYLQLLEAQQTLIAVRAGYIDTLANYNSALADLEQAAGEDLK